MGAQNSVGPELTVVHRGYKVVVFCPAQ